MCISSNMPFLECNCPPRWSCSPVLKSLPSIVSENKLQLKDHWAKVKGQMRQIRCCCTTTMSTNFEKPAISSLWELAWTKILEGGTEGPTDEWMDGRTDGQMDGWTEWSITICPLPRKREHKEDCKQAANRKALTVQCLQLSHQCLLSSLWSPWVSSRTLYGLHKVLLQSSHLRCDIFPLNMPRRCMDVPGYINNCQNSAGHILHLKMAKPTIFPWSNPFMLNT